jgi:hypothetical protein
MGQAPTYGVGFTTIAQVRTENDEVTACIDHLTQS